jgi:type II secretory pathway pseudopilin PulG
MYKTKRWILWVSKVVVLLVYLVMLAYIVIVGMAFVLQLMGANPQADFADWVYRAAANITEPFRGIFPTTQITDRSTFNASLLFAIIVYIVLAVALHALIDWLTRNIAGVERAEEQQRREAELQAQDERMRAALYGPSVAEPVANPAFTPTASPVVAEPPAVEPAGVQPAGVQPAGPYSGAGQAAGPAPSSEDLNPFASSWQQPAEGAEPSPSPSPASSPAWTPGMPVEPPEPMLPSD